MSRSAVFQADCPECHKTCWWCSAYLWMVRQSGCCSVFYPKKRSKCPLAKQEQGRRCDLCNESRRVMVEQKIIAKELA